jgi:hypothetical protein
VAVPSPGAAQYRYACPGEPVSPEDFDALFDRFRHTAFRLETLPTYDVGDDVGEEATRIRAIREHLPVPERSVRSDPWLARIARTTLDAEAPKQWRRVRVVDEPLTEYQRIELVALVEAQAVGDENFLVPRGAVGDVPDMWLFDAGHRNAHAVVMNYDAAGQWLGCHMVTDRPALVQLDEAWERALAAAEPLNVFLARHGLEAARVSRV